MILRVNEVIGNDKIILIEDIYVRKTLNIGEILQFLKEANKLKYRSDARVFETKALLSLYPEKELEIIKKFDPGEKKRIYFEDGTGMLVEKLTEHLVSARWI